MTVGENTASSVASIFWYFASATITIGTPAAIASRNGARYPSSEVVTSSTTAAVKSVFPVTRPSPGKCLPVVAMPASAIPFMNAIACALTVAGSWP